MAANQECHTDAEAMELRREMKEWSMRFLADGRRLKVDPYRLMGLIAVVVSGMISSLVLGFAIPAIGDGIVSLAFVVTGAI